MLEDEEEAEALPFVGSMRMSDGQAEVLEALQSLLDLEVTTLHAQPDPDAAFDLLRTTVEDHGVFVLLRGDLGSYHTSIDTELFRGFTIADEIAPLVVINDNDARPAWTFTLLHELVHVLLGQSGVGSVRVESDVETFCDSVAGRFLLPAAELDLLDLNEAIQSDIAFAGQISEFGNDRNLSRSMVAFRACQAGLISQDSFNRLYAMFRRQWAQERSRRRDKNRRTGDGGPDYYVVRRHRLGRTLPILVRRTMGTGALSTAKAAKVLGVKPTQVEALLEMDRPR